MVNLELYRIFVVVANNKSITDAARDLNISQPAVTRHIKNLEEFLKVQLFIRKNNGIELTSEGLALYNQIKEPIDSLLGIKNKYSFTKTIKLGCHPVMLNTVFNNGLIRYYRENEKTRVDIKNSTTKNMLLKLENKELDILLLKEINLNYNKNKITYINLGMLNDVLVARYDSKFADKKITLEELKEQEIYLPYEDAITTINFLNSVGCELSEFKNAKNIIYNIRMQIIRETDSIGLVTKKFIEEEINAKTLRILNTDFELKPIRFGIYLNETNRSKEVDRFIEILKEEFKNTKEKNDE